MRRRSLALLTAAALLAGCQRDERMENILRLQRLVLNQREALGREAAQKDPTRTDLTATYVDSSVMQYRPTSNPERPIVAQVQIKWRFQHADGRPAGEAVFDYIFALDRAGKWIKADEPEGGTSPAPTEIRLPFSPAGSPRPA